MHRIVEELLSRAQERSVPPRRIALENEMELTEKTEQQVFDRLEKIYGVMECSVTKALSGPQHAIGGLTIGASQIQNEYSNLDSSLRDPWTNHSMALAFSCSEVNAAMGKICAAPTVGACGIPPAVFLSMRDKRGLTLQEVLCGLLTVAGFGTIITRNATVARAGGGCQVECDVTATTVSAAVVELCHGSPEAALYAGSFCLMNVMGLVCDPVVGLAQVPCAQRNASQAVNALLSADWTSVGQRSVIPPDQVIATMYHIGKMFPTQLHGTAQGGLTATPAAKSISENIFIKHEENEAF